MEIFGKDLRNQAMKIINNEKKEMIPLPDKETESHEKQKVSYICEKNLVLIGMIKMNSNYTIKSEIMVITQENLEVPLIIFVI